MTIGSPAIGLPIVDVSGGLSDGLAAVRSALDEGAISTALMVLGDSTGNETNEFFYLLCQYLASTAPNVRVQHKLWNDTNQDYDAWTVIQAGASGERSIRFTGTMSRYQAAADIGDWTSDIDVRVRASLDNWVPGATNPVLVARFGAAGSRGFRFYINTTGTIVFEWSTDGTTLLNVQAAAQGFSNGSVNWLRATLVAATGVATLYKSADGATWTQIGTTTAGATSINKPAGINYEIGARGNGATTDALTGNIYEVQIRDGIGGKILDQQPIEAWRPRQLSDGTSLAGSATLYCINGSAPGQGLTYLTDSTRLPKMAQPYEPVHVMLNTSHNDGLLNISRSLMTAWDGWLSSLKSRLPVASFSLMTQNPKTPGVDYYESHAKRTRQVMHWAARNGVACIDTYRALVQGGAPNSLIASDGTHPDAIGRAVWAAAVQKPFQVRQ